MFLTTRGVGEASGASERADGGDTAGGRRHLSILANARGPSNARIPPSGTAADAQERASAKPRHEPSTRLVLYPERSAVEGRWPSVRFPDEALINDLEEAAHAVCPGLGEVARRLAAAGLPPAILCGSGAATYVKVDDPARMAEIGARLRALGLGRILAVQSLRRSG